MHSRKLFPSYVRVFYRKQFRAYVSYFHERREKGSRTLSELFYAEKSVYLCGYHVAVELYVDEQGLWPYGVLSLPNLTARPITSMIVLNTVFSGCMARNLCTKTVK